jgi:hypothetical protein
MSNVTTTTKTVIAPWIVEFNEEAIAETVDYTATLTRDSDGKYCPQFGSSWLKADAKKATRLAQRTFSGAKVELSSAFGVDADELFA